MAVSVVCLAGCVSAGLPSASERAALRSGTKAIVLLRVVGTMDGEPYESFRHLLPDDNIAFGLGSFDTGGELRHVPTVRFLSPESRRQGWTYFLLDQGTYYFAVLPPRDTDIGTYKQRARSARPDWRIDVPYDATLLYAGTLRVVANSKPGLFGRLFSSILNEDIILSSDDHDAARRLVAEHFPELGDVRVVTMQRHDGAPIILRSPLPTPRK